jgi:hypothetical protein
MGSENRISELHSFLKEVKHRPFQWGVWDCLIFTNEAFRRMDGEGWADDLLTRYMQNNKLLTRAQIRREYGHETVEDMLQDRMQRAYDVPPRGALVTSSATNLRADYLGVGFGIAVGSSAAFLSQRGVVYCPIEYIDSAWVKE